jgi:hypothetical protein
MFQLLKRAVIFENVLYKLYGDWTLHLHPSENSSECKKEAHNFSISSLKITKPESHIPCIKAFYVTITSTDIFLRKLPTIY